MKNKRLIGLMVILLFLFATYVYGFVERKEFYYKNKQHFQSEANLNDQVNFGTDAVISTPTTEPLHATNFIKNSYFSAWSGATTQRGGAPNASPDGWAWCLTNTGSSGASRVDLSDVLTAGSGATEIRYGYPHSMLLSNSSTSVTDWMLYPGKTGVSNSRSWYQQFAGREVTFSADVFVPTLSGSTFIRAFIRTSANGITPWAANSTFGDFANNAPSWQTISATTTIPAGATALDFGFYVAPNPRIRGGCSAYVVAPRFNFGALNTEFVPVIGETIFFDETFNALSSGSNFGVQPAGDAGSAMDLSADTTGWEGRIPDEATAIYATVRAEFASVNDPLHFYGDDIAGGVTMYGSSTGGLASTDTFWIPISGSGTINVDNVAAVAGVSLFVHGMKL